jgi:hypothetical protein
MEDKGKIRIGRLTSVGMCGIEIGRIYRKVRHGELNSADGMRMVQMLLGLKSCLETSEVERKILELEQALAAPSKVLPFQRKLTAG